MAVNAQGVDVTEELAERASEAFAAQQDKKVMKKLKLSADCIPADKIADFLRAMGCNPSSAEIVEATQYADPDGEGVARLPSLMKPLALLLAKPPITESDLTAALGVFDKDGKGLTLEEMRAVLSNFGDCMSPEECDEYLAMIEVNSCARLAACLSCPVLLYLTGRFDTHDDVSPRWYPC